MKLNLGEFIIHKYKILDWKYKKYKLLEIYNKSEKRKYGNVITNWNINLETKEYLKQEVKKIILNEINTFKMQLNGDYDIESIWFQEYNQYMNHDLHNHGVGYSSVLYIKYDPRYHKSTTFVSNSDKKIYSPEVEEGEIIFFNSKYNHFCPKNESTKTRIVCAFNLKKSINISYN